MVEYDFVTSERLQMNTVIGVLLWAPIGIFIVIIALFLRVIHSAAEGMEWWFELGDKIAGE